MSAVASGRASEAMLGVCPDALFAITTICVDVRERIKIRAGETPQLIKLSYRRKSIRPTSVRPYLLLLLPLITDRHVDALTLGYRLGSDLDAVAGEDDSRGRPIEQDLRPDHRDRLRLPMKSNLIRAPAEPSYEPTLAFC